MEDNHCVKNGFFATSPKVSVILPAYNSERFLADAIRSVLNQSFKEWELIVIDDGSIDTTAGVVRGFSDRRITFLQQPNFGVSSARNCGLDVAQGEYVTFLDADDVLPEFALELLVQQSILKPDADIISGLVAVVEGETGDVLRVWAPRFEGDPLLPLLKLSESVFFGVCVFIRKPPPSLRFAEHFTHCEDILFLIEYAARRTLLFVSIPECVYLQRYFRGSAMSNLAGLEKGYRQLYKVVSEYDHPRIGWTCRIQLKLRYVRIMFLTYLKARKYTNALRMSLDLLGLR